MIFHQEMMRIWNHAMVQWLRPPGILSSYWEKQQRKTPKWQQKTHDKHRDGLKVLPPVWDCKKLLLFLSLMCPIWFWNLPSSFLSHSQLSFTRLAWMIRFVGSDHVPLNLQANALHLLLQGWNFLDVFLTGFGSCGKNSNVGRMWKKGIICMIKSPPNSKSRSFEVSSHYFWRHLIPSHRFVTTATKGTPKV